MESNYVQLATEILRKGLWEDLDPELERLYVLLVLTRGEQTTLRDVHDARAVWRIQSNTQHKSRVRFEDLTPEMQGVLRIYMQAIRDTSVRLNKGY